MTKPNDIYDGDPPYILSSTVAARLHMDKFGVLSMIERCIQREPKLQTLFRFTRNPVDCRIARGGLETIMPRFWVSKSLGKMLLPDWLSQFDSLQGIPTPEVTAVAAPVKLTKAERSPQLPLTAPEAPLPLIADRLVGGDLIQTVNARDLHRALGIVSRFADWITDRISHYSFNENSDFVIILEKEKNSVGRPTKEYALTVDTAKELAMVERNEAGKRVRRYFIECERRLRASPTPAPSFAIPKTLPEALRLAANLAEQVQQQMVQIEDLSAHKLKLTTHLKDAAPAISFYAQFGDAEGRFGWTMTAKMLNQKPRQFIDRCKQHLCYYLGKTLVPRQEYIDRGLCCVRAGMNKTDRACAQGYFTPKGVLWVATKFDIKIKPELKAYLEGLMQEEDELV